MPSVDMEVEEDKKEEETQALEKELGIRRDYDPSLGKSSSSGNNPA